MNHTAIAAAVLVSALITLALRAFPFLLARIARRYDTTFAWLGRVMPPGVMTILALYAARTLKRQPPSAP
ncbi:MAG: branched-chain amino acid ABC transporter, partial [Cardiobacterium hominis]